METGGTQTNGTSGSGVESCIASSDGVEGKDRIAVRGTSKERRPSRRRWLTDKNSGDVEDPALSVLLRPSSMIPNQGDDAPSQCLCQACNSTIPSIADHYAIQLCRHTLCHICTVKSHIERGCKPHTCPVAGCNRYLTGVILQLHGGGSGNKSTLIRNRIVGNTDYVKSHLPVTWLKERHRSEIEASEDNEGIVISCSKIRKMKNGNVDRQSITSTFVLHHRGVNMPIEVLDHVNALEEIGKVFGFLHEPIAKTSNCFIHELHQKLSNG